MKNSRKKNNLMTRIYLSPPHVFGNERALVTDVLTPAAFGVLRRRGRKNPAGWILSANVFDSNWIAPLPGLPDAEIGEVVVAPRPF